MMGQVVSRAMLRAKGRAAFFAGQGRDSHNMNPGSPAIVDWQDGWDRGHAAWSLSGWR